jgi:hypothetical protein
MKDKYETLDEYLDDLDKIKEESAKRTEGMTPEQVRVYFAGALRRLREKTGLTLRLPRVRRQRRTAKR